MAVSPEGVREDMLPEKWAAIAGFERKVLGLEMEGAGLFYTLSVYNDELAPGQHRCEVLLVKGVMDFADPDKDDAFKLYGLGCMDALSLEQVCTCGSIYR